MRYKAEIDGLRAIAIIPVILFHAGFTLFSGGYVGVDIFFVISGYLITSIIISDLNKHSFSFSKFYERRARRIFPALFFVIFATIPFAWLWLLPEDLKNFSKSLYFVAIFSSNILFWRTSGYFDGDAELKPLLHTWSLGIEEQYYLLFPALMLLLWRLNRKIIGWTIALLLMTSLYFTNLKIAENPMSAFYFLPYRAWELLIGALIAHYDLSSKRKISGYWPLQIFSLLGGALIFFSVFFLDKNTPYPSYFTLLPVVGAALLILFAKPNTWIYKLIANKIFVATGLISYSAYLWHQPIFALAKHRLGNDLDVIVLVCLVCLVFCLSYFSWKFIEQPFRSREVIHTKRLIMLALLSLIFIVSAGSLGDLNDGFPSRFQYNEKYAGDIGQEPFYLYAKQKNFVCTPEHIAKQSLMWNDISRCMQSKNNAPISMVLLGDSHAEHLFIGLSESLNKVNLAFYIKATPALIRNPEFNEIFKEIADNKSVHTVLLSMYWVGKIYALPKGQSFDKELADTVAFLVNSGKKVVIFNDIPRFPFPAERCKFFANEIGRSTCEISKWSILRYELYYNPMLEQLAKKNPNVRYVSLRDLFCTSDSCSMIHDDAVMYRDSHHLNIVGSKFVGQEIAKLLPDLNN
jgi:peptidoglycan/LPS O-acetylase OafA/YrhL